jgi:peptidylprolyl isomerase
VRGVVSMARGLNPNSGDCQFFILTGADPSLDGNYTLWGQVVRGMDLIDKLKTGDKAKNGRVTNPDRILSLRVASDPPRPAKAPARTK